MEEIRGNLKIANVQVVVLAGRRRKVFDYYKLIGGAWVYAGCISAPPNVKLSDLFDFIGE